jgi:hypothetical protein
MRSVTRSFLAAVCVGILIVFAALAVSSVQAQTSIPKPAVPTFTAALVDRSYDVLATTLIDQYTGQTINHPAHRVENYTVDITIKNQPYTSTVLQEGTAQWNTSFVYNIRIKGHFAQDWIPMYFAGEGPKMSNSDYTIITYPLSSLPLQHDQGYTLDSPDSSLSTNTIYGFPRGSQLDFQVEALSGYWTRTIEVNSMHFESVESGWSNTQTVTIPDNTATSTPNNSASSIPTINTGPIVNNYLGLNYAEIIIIAILSVIAILMVVLIAVLQRRKVK